MHPELANILAWILLALIGIAFVYFFIRGVRNFLSSFQPKPATDEITRDYVKSQVEKVVEAAIEQRVASKPAK